MSATSTSGPGKHGLSEPLQPAVRGQTAAYIGRDGLAHAPDMLVPPDAIVTEVTGGTHLAREHVHHAGLEAIPCAAGGLRTAESDAFYQRLGVGPSVLDAAGAATPIDAVSSAATGQSGSTGLGPSAQTSWPASAPANPSPIAGNLLPSTSTYVPAASAAAADADDLDERYRGHGIESGSGPVDDGSQLP